MKVVLILGGIMLFAGIVCNVVAFVIEKKYKSKMSNTSNE